ncbi:hypothetical protein Trisim1_011072 [Trichoderma cf. simile WF8]
MAKSQFDFIVVGGGTSGSVVASRLAQTRAQPSVLLLEAGGANSGLTHRCPGESSSFYTSDEAAPLNYRYRADLGDRLKGRELQYDRGRGLGGTSCINIGLWDYGSPAEMDEWAALVGDQDWSWAATQERMQKIENVHYVDGNGDERGLNGQTSKRFGPVDVSQPVSCAPALKMILGAAKEWSVIPDISHGALGLSVPPFAVYKGLRITAASAYLSDLPCNLVVKVESMVARIILDEGIAKGVELGSGQKYFAFKDVIICAGTFDTPKILMLSGIGPPEELAEHGIPVQVPLSGVGQNLADHPSLRLYTRINVDAIPSDGKPGGDVSTWRDQWLKDQKGPLAMVPNKFTNGYFKIDNLEHLSGWKQLDDHTKDYLMRPLTSNIEYLATIIPDPSLLHTVLRISVLLMNAQSRGKVHLKSSDQAAPPRILLNYLQHPFDLQVMIQGVRKAMGFAQSAGFAHGSFDGLKSGSDDDIMDYTQRNLQVSWHAMGTIKMGKPADETAVVGPDLRVFGVQKLRVADLSVCPVIPSNHTQSTAYLIGEVAAEKLIAEYSLDLLTTG